MASGSGEHKLHRRKAVGLEWDVYDDNTQKAKTCWKNVAQPWSAGTAMEYVGFPHFDRLWPRHCYERNCKAVSASYVQLEDVEAKWRFLTILRNISNLDRWPRSAIPKSVACMMYAEHVLRIRVDWSTMGALDAQKFGAIGVTFIKYKVPDIPHTPVPEWFRRNHGLVDLSWDPNSRGSGTKKPRSRRRAANDVVMAIEEAFEHMDNGMEVVHNQENMGHVEVNNLINEMVNEVVNLCEHEVDTMDNRMKKLCKQHAEEIRKYKARILDLKNQVAKLTMREAGSSSSTLIAPTNNHIQSLQAEKDIAVQKTKIVKIQAMEVCTRTAAIQKNVMDMQQQFQVVNEVVVNHKSMIYVLEERNAMLKKHLRDAIMGRKNMRICTLLATAKTLQFEVAFESIQKE